MDTKLLKSNFQNKLASSNNCDIFGADGSIFIHWGKLFIHLFSDYYSKYWVKQKIDSRRLCKYLIDRYSVERFQILKLEKAVDYNAFDIDTTYTEVLIILKEGLFFGISDDYIQILYSANISDEELRELIQIIDDYKTTQTKENKFYMIKYSDMEFELGDYDVKNVEMDITTHYNDDFQEIHDLIVNLLRTKGQNGIILLHGVYGSGKTYYIRHLINNIDRKFIYLPVNLIRDLNTPQFLPFISRYPNSIIILEDCESALVPRASGTYYTSAISNLLNLGDGLLSDALQINIICTFNTGIKRIDDAILRKGRLLASYEFKELEQSKAQSLAVEIGKDAIINKSMTVADIYNLENKSFANKSSVRSIGFQTVKNEILCQKETT